MGDNKKRCLGRIWCVTQIFIHLLDLLTDCTTLLVYWNNNSTTVFVLALLSIIVSIPIGIATYLYQFRQCMGGENAKSQLLTLKLIGILLESIPQLTINLYILSSCDKETSSIQWISAAVSFTAICVGVVHYDISIRLHKKIGPVQKFFILMYRSNYLAARMLAFVYFTYTLTWWAAAVMVVHWLIGLFCLMRNKVETVARSLAFVFLNTFIYIGEFGGISALFILILYVMENFMMTAVVYIVRLMEFNAVSATTAAIVTTQVSTVSDGFQSSNDFLPLQPPRNASNLDDFFLPTLCVKLDTLAVHIGLNVIAIAMCCLYNVSFHYTICMKDEYQDATYPGKPGLNQGAEEMRVLRQINGV